jgi:excisionase family DNA binding protein
LPYGQLLPWAHETALVGLQTYGVHLVIDTYISDRRQTMNIEEAARILGINRSTAYDLAARDELPVPVIRLGRRMVVSKRALDDLLAAQHSTTNHDLP